MKGNETDGRIKGIVMDGELGGPLEFVTVQVKAKGSDKILQGAVTGSDGNYSIGGLKKGEYVVTFSYIGYAVFLKISQSATILKLLISENSPWKKMPINWEKWRSSMQKAPNEIRAR